MDLNNKFAPTRFKRISLFKPQLIKNSTLESVSLDVLKHKFAQFVLEVGASDVALSNVRLEERNSTDDSWTVVPNSAVSSTLLTAVAVDNKCFSWHVTLQGRKRNVRLVATVADGTNGANLCAYAITNLDAERINTAAQRGYDTVITPVPFDAI